MKRAILAACVAVFATATAAQSDEWVTYASSSDGAFSCSWGTKRARKQADGTATVWTECRVLKQDYATQKLGWQRTMTENRVDCRAETIQQLAMHLYDDGPTPTRSIGAGAPERPIPNSMNEALLQAFCPPAQPIKWK